MRAPITVSAAIVVGLLTACSPEEQRGSVAQDGQVASSNVAAVDEPGQTRQLRELAKDPQSISDKLFILWEFGGALRERELAKTVLRRSSDPEIKSLAVTVRDGHQAGIDTMVPIANELGIRLPHGPTAAELAAIEAASALPVAELERYFLLRQRAMHAWDITVFGDYGAVARNERLRRYVAEVRAPLRDHAETVVRLSNKRGIPGQLSVVHAEPSN